MNRHLCFNPWTQPNSLVNFPYVWMGDSFSYLNSWDISVSNNGANQNEKWMPWDKCYNLILWLSFKFASQRKSSGKGLNKVLTDLKQKLAHTCTQVSIPNSNSINQSVLPGHLIPYIMSGNFVFGRHRKIPWGWTNI